MAGAAEIHDELVVTEIGCDMKVRVS